jgi:crotonobetainyl-CoA:carnitine CoA-transferase CaiB-like acyl-CoA transferase
VMALYHRERTGQGQKVDASIINATLLTASNAYITADGTGAARPRLDAMQMGLGALYRLYQAGDGWLCVAAIDQQHWRQLCTVVGRSSLADDPRFSTAEARREHDAALIAILETIFPTRPAREWFELLDGAGVPCEISSPTFSRNLFDDPEIIGKQWIAGYQRAQVGKLEEHGLGFDFSETPGRIWGPAPLCGQDTREILAELGYSRAEINELCAGKVVLDAADPDAGLGITRVRTNPASAIPAAIPGAKGAGR